MIVPIEKLNLPLWQTFGVELYIIRLDQTHPHISGNKWFKLQPALERAKKHPNQPLLSFGGAFSNHLHALAYAGFLHGLSTMAIIRGEQPKSLNPTLQDMKNWGMQLHFVSRAEYAQRYRVDYLDHLRQRFGDVQIIPEGGSSSEAVNACGEIWKHLSKDQPLPDYLGCALGTGATVAGLIANRPLQTQVIVVPALKISALEATQMLHQHWQANHADRTDQIELKEGFTVFDGELPYARVTPMMAALWQRLSTCYGIDLDPVYTLRVYHRLSRLLQQGHFPAGSKVALLHTGGLQGIRGCQQQLQQRSAAYIGPLPI
ncbi:1-aminocyclopropane-1-carboxylate deaminase/D-cysteine desulfhydrase [Nitrincola schmidtii]|uniref:1-aminocyclopropane-1-carboxylate deaminase/D-cysteine desulfhydrase n=1 Tax=Nitrincola schmidtii TaxID=1730894 RepID=UPI00124EC553|nr:pyridoxal-phosphate dependent enzyme [Nitrincola schmidtii]